LALSVAEARAHFDEAGIKVLGIHAVCGLLQWLSIPTRVRDARQWDKGFLEHVVEMLVRLSEEPSTQGLSRHLVVYGERL
jgi:hypothetical protein